MEIQLEKTFMSDANLKVDEKNSIKKLYGKCRVSIDANKSNVVIGRFGFAFEQPPLVLLTMEKVDEELFCVHYEISELTKEYVKFSFQNTGSKPVNLILHYSVRPF